MSCSRTQHGDGRSRTPDLSLRSPTLYHWATALPSKERYRTHTPYADTSVLQIVCVDSVLRLELTKGTYRKCPKYSDTQKICCNHSKIWTMWLYHRVMSPNDADGMANSVDPDQTAPLGAVWSGSALFAQACLSENLGSLRYNQRRSNFACNIVSLDICL